MIVDKIALNDRNTKKMLYFKSRINDLLVLTPLGIYTSSSDSIIFIDGINYVVLVFNLI